MNHHDIAARIDHTLLKPEATAEQIDRLCREALEHGFAAVCVNPIWVPRCVERLASHAGHRPAVCSVAGFPLGAVMSQSKALDATLAVRAGATEIDMVVNIAALIEGDRNAAVADIAAVVAAAKSANPAAIVKVILETRALTDEQIVLGCECAIAARANFVKTSTGFHAGGGATVEHVALLRRHAGSLLVKASGGIRDAATARAMIDAGAARLGTSAGVAIARELASLSTDAVTSAREESY